MQVMQLYKLQKQKKGLHPNCLEGQGLVDTLVST
jgi:hypothetical protein